MSSFAISASDEAQALTGPQGSFELDGLRVDVPHIVVCEDDRGGLALRYAPAGDAVQDLGVVSLLERGQAEGLLQARQSVPLAGATVRLTATDASSILPEDCVLPFGTLSALTATATVGPSGRFVVAGVPGVDSELVVEFGGHRVLERVIRLESGAVTDLGRIEVDVVAELVAGVLLDLDHRPAMGRRLLVVRAGRPPWAVIDTSGQGRFTVAVTPERSQELFLTLIDELGRPVARWAESLRELPALLRVPGGG